MAGLAIVVATLVMGVISTADTGAAAPGPSGAAYVGTAGGSLCTFVAAPHRPATTAPVRELVLAHCPAHRRH